MENKKTYFSAMKKSRTRSGRSYGMPEGRNYGSTELRNQGVAEGRNNGDTEGRTRSAWKDGTKEQRNYEDTDSRNYGSTEGRTRSAWKDGTKEQRNYGSTEVRSFEGTLKPLMTEEDASRNQGSHGSTEPRTFGGTLKPLMSEAEKADAQILELSYDFSCRIIRLYKFLNEGKLSKADRDIIDAVGRQLVRSATSINANINEAQHPQSDSDFLSKASIALKEAKESENWLSLLRDNGFLSTVQAESLLNDCSRINRILITITAKVRKRLNS